MTRFSNRLTLGLGALTLALGIGTAGIAAAQDQDRPERGPGMRRGGPGGFIGGGGPGGPLGGLMLGGIDLTDAQREQIQTIVEARRAADEPLTERARTARQALQAAIQAEAVDEGAIRAHSAELSAAETDLAVSRARLQADILNLLTPEQRTAVAERRERMSERSQDRREEFRERRGR